MADDESEDENPSLDKTSDLSSLITLDIPSDTEPGSMSPDAPIELSSDSPQPDEPIQFERLEEISPEIPIQLATEEAPPSGLDLSLVDTPDPAEASASAEAEHAPDPEPDPSPDASSAPSPGIDSIKKFSENLAATEPRVDAIFPFTLKIEGRLAPEEAEKLLTVLTRENMGFREVDLEPQIAEGRILIPRISEYAGVLLIQALRGISARISFGPSDEIFSTPETRDEPLRDGGGFAASEATRENREGIDRQAGRETGHETGHEIGKIPVITAESFPGFTRTEVIDTVVASGLLTTHAVEAASSEDYENLLEALIRELRFKAHRRGANGILALRVQLTPLTLPTDYRLTVTGTAVTGS